MATSRLAVAKTLTFLLAYSICHTSAQSFGPGTFDGCEDAGWVRVAGSCYYFPSKSTVENAPMRTQSAADAFCSALTMPRTTQIGNDTITVNFTDTAHLASFSSHSAWESFLSAADAPYHGGFGDILRFWIGCSFSSASGMATWSDNSPFLYANWMQAGMLASFASDGQCVATVSQFTLADSWALSPAGAPVAAFPLCKRRAKMQTCPLGWITVPNSPGRCYLPQSDVQRTYSDAKADCAALASSPFSPTRGGTPELSRWETATEASNVMTHAIRQSNDAVFYVDLVRDWNTPEGFRWGGPGSGGPPLSANPGVSWNSYQPSNFGGVQGHVVALTITPTLAGLSDVDGRLDHRGYLCESAPEDAADYSLVQLLANTGRIGDVNNIKHVDDCPAGWTQHGHRCFVAQRPSSRKTFTEARAICAGLGGAAELASLEGVTDDIFQRSLYLSLPSAQAADMVVTGAEYTTAARWSWVDGAAWDTLADTQPVGSQNNDHLFFDLGNAFSTYLDAVTVQRSGVTAHGFVCAQPLVTPGGCAEGWVRDHRAGSSDCWMLGTHSLFQAEGQAHCRAMGGELASLHSEGDRAVARQLMSPSSMLGDTTAAFIAPVDDVIGDRFGPVRGGVPAFANYTLRNSDSSPWDYSSWGGSLPDLAVWDLPARVQVQSQTGRMASSRFPAAVRSGYICRAAAAASRSWRSPPALAGGGTTTADTGTDSDFDTSTSDPSLTQYGFMGDVYRADEPCPFGGGWVPVNSWCYKALPVAAGMPRTTAASTCAGTAPGAMLAPLAEYGEAEAAGVVTELDDGERLWFGCSVRNTPGQPGYGEVFLDDGTPLKYANWGPSFNASTDIVPGWGCSLYTSPSSGVPLWRMEPPGGMQGVQYGAVCAVRAKSTVHGTVPCGVGWRYVRNDAGDGDYCYSNIRQRSLYREIEELCDAQGATVGAIVDMQQSERLDTFFRHPLVSSEETYWIGITRMQDGGNGCAWGNANTGQLLGSDFTRWEVPDAQGTSCIAPAAYVRITQLWGVPTADNQRRAAVCQLRPAGGSVRPQSNPRGYVTFVPPVQAGSFFANEMSGAPSGTTLCGFLFGDASAHPVLLTLTSTDGEGWGTGWQATLSAATEASVGAGTPPQLPMRLGRGYTSQTLMCLQPSAPTTVCPAIFVVGGAQGQSDANIAVTITDARPSAAGGPSAILGHGRGGNSAVYIKLPGVQACIALQPSANPTPASTRVPAASASSAPAASASSAPAASASSAPAASASSAPAASATPSTTKGGSSSGGGGNGAATPAASTGTDPNGAGGGGGGEAGGGSTGSAPSNGDSGGSGRDTTTPLAVSLIVATIVLVALGVVWYRRRNAPSPAPKTIAHDVHAPGASLQYSASGGPSSFDAFGGIEMGSTGVVNPLSAVTNGSGAHRAATIHGRQDRVTAGGQRRGMPPPY